MSNRHKRAQSRLRADRPHAVHARHTGPVLAFIEGRADEIEIATSSEFLVMALYMSIKAPSVSQSDEVFRMAKMEAAWMDVAAVEQCKNIVDELLIAYPDPLPYRHCRP